MRAEGFSCRLNISKLLFLIDIKTISAVCFPVFGNENPGFGLNLNPDPDPNSLEMLDPHPDPDPQLCLHRVLM